MAPTVSQLSLQLKQIIFYHLDNEFLENALFAAGRFHSLEPRNADAVHLLCLCYLRLRKFKTTYDYSRLVALKGTHLGCSYVFAQACFALGRTSDGISALERTRMLWQSRNHWNYHSETGRKHVPDAAAVYCLLGKLHHMARDTRRACEAYSEALKFNPFMWDAFERLCETNARTHVSNIFRFKSEVMPYQTHAGLPHSFSRAEEYNQTHALAPTNASRSLSSHISPVTDTSRAARSNGVSALSTGNHNLLSKTNLPGQASRSLDSAEDEYSTDIPSMRPQSIKGAEEKIFSNVIGSTESSDPTGAPPRNARLVQPSMVDQKMDSSKTRPFLGGRHRLEQRTEDDQAMKLSQVSSQHKRTISGSLNLSNAAKTVDTVTEPTRRSRRLFDQFNQTKAHGPQRAASHTQHYSRELEDSKKARPIRSKIRAVGGSLVGKEVGVNHKTSEGYELNSMRPKLAGERFDTEKDVQERELLRYQESVRQLLELYCKFGRGHFLLSRYRCDEALRIFQSLPIQHRESPWVLRQIGKAYFEQGNHKEAEKAFARIRKIAPTVLENMEYYSTVLWHLKNETELAFLAHEFMDIDRLSPQAWCALGNSLSLQKEHDQAIKCFRRSTQVDKSFAYGFTLGGHEHMANEEYHKALYAYRKAISVDSRHYNGWYGLGKVFEKFGNYDMAEKHFTVANHINQTNAILLCCIGVIQEKQMKPQAALAHYTRACALAPSSAMSRFKKARILLHLRHFREALREFTILKDVVPDESNVHFMLGRVYNKLHDRPNAIRHLTTAMNLDPKAAPHIKEAMEALNDDDSDEEDDFGS